MNAYEAFTRYAWHDPNNEPFCEGWWRKVPVTEKGWVRLPKECACGFYQTLHQLRSEHGAVA